MDPLGASAIVADPQSFNRYTYVLNNPLKYVDPDGLDAKNPWADLTDEERKLLASKLTTVTGKNQSAAAQDAFNTMVKRGTKTDEQIANNVASVQNFVGSLGHDEKVWGEITSITTVNVSGDGKQSDVGFTIKDQKGFTDAVTAMKDPATGLQRFAWLGDHDWGDHKDSIREMAQDTGAASMHLESTNAARTTEAAHWDVSSFFTENTWGNIFKDSIPIYGEGRHINAGVRHLREGRATTGAVRQELKNKNLVPR